MVNGDGSFSISTTVALALVLSASILPRIPAATVSTTTQVPPLQWINLSKHVQGSGPPPLKDASIGYDSIHNAIVLFGGESQQGIPQSQTYSLDLSTLTWSQPTPANGVKTLPPARSAALSGPDNAASYRNGHIIIGGRGVDGSPLNDVWEFDYNNQFWSQVTVSGGPSARWGAAGGSDPRTAFNLESLTNSFYLAGGFASDSTASLSDVWRLDVTGTLSSNVQSLTGNWTQLHLPNTSLPTIGGSATGVIELSAAQAVIASGGCSKASGSTAACAEGDSYVLNIGSSGNSNTAPGSCPAPRTGATLALNRNTASSSFATQAFLLLGTFDSSQWQDGGGLAKGEVDVLDINTGSWARILPSPDPSSDGETVPSPREGAAVFSLTQPVSDSIAATDTIVFGGRDANGNYLDELWVLRAYNGSVTSSGQKWSGFGNGDLEGGPTASGQGVTVTYLTSCATQVAQSSGSSSGSSTSSPTSTGSPSSTSAPSSPTTVNSFDTSVIHKSLAPVSVALVLPAIVFYRLSQPSLASTQSTNARLGFFYLTALIALVAFALGIGGLATAFTSIQYTTSIVKRSGVPHLTTPHGRAGVALFVGLYGLIPALIAVSAILKRRDDGAALAAKRRRTTSNDMAEKIGLRSGSPFTPDSLPHEPPPPERARSGDWHVGHVPGTRRSSESAADDRSSPSTRSFEVTNRPQRARHASAHSLAAMSDPRPSAMPRNISDLTWFDRRRSDNGDVDYLNSQFIHRAPTPGTTALEGLSIKGSVLPDTPVPGEPIMPNGLDTLIHLLLHAFLIGLCVLSIVALFDRANVATFAVFIAWTACFYIVIAVMAWHGVPSESILTVFIARLKNPPAPETPPAPVDGVPFPVAPGGPYQHQPSYRAATDADYPTSLGHTAPEDDYDDDDDEDTRQRRIEDEINRRDVSIVTVPKRKLVITNPELR